MRRQFVLRGMGLLTAVVADGAGPAAAQGRPIVIGYQDQPDWLLFVARDFNLFEKAGLSPIFVKFDGGPPMVEAMRDGRLDLASVGSVPFLIGLSQGVDWTMIGINPEGAYGVGLVAGKDSNIRTPTDLRGKRVGLFVGATAQFGFLMMLRQHGIRREQVTVVNLAPDAQLLALQAGRIDAAMVGEPWMHRMIRNADGRIIATEGSLGIYTNVDCYSVRRDWLKANRDTALRFLKALVIANDAVSKDHRVAHHAWAREVGLRNATVEAIFDVVPPPLIYEWTNPRYTYSLVRGGPFYQRLGFLANYMVRYGIISQPVELDNAMDMSLIAEVLKGKKPP
ncbi:MAG: ABC transporter substrate-binding protein [Reyranella sp.]|nr:ABC transporter substrate-binding protein [Reyranella sp.]